MRYSITLALTSLLSVAFGAPAEVAEAGSGTLAKRAEGIHLVNCIGFGGETIIPQRSLVVYCPNDSSCSNPSSDNICVMKSGGDFFHWEGAQFQCTFPTGITAGWNIDSAAQSKANYVQVGGGWNDYRAFTAYKDDQHNMFTYNADSTCYSIYYLL